MMLPSRTMAASTAAAPTEGFMREIEAGMSYVMHSELSSCLAAPYLSPMWASGGRREYIFLKLSALVLPSGGSITSMESPVGRLRKVLVVALLTLFMQVVAFCKEKGIDVVLVGPEIPLVAGLADDLEAAGIVTWGPKANAAALEGSKSFMKVCRTCLNLAASANGSVKSKVEVKWSSFSWPEERYVK